MNQLNVVLLADISQGLSHDLSVVEEMLNKYASSKPCDLIISKNTVEELRINPRFIPTQLTTDAQSHSKKIAIIWERLTDCQLLHDPSILKIFIPNPEVITRSSLSLLKHVDHIWHKTRLSLEAFRDMAPQAAHFFTGFTSQDPQIVVKNYEGFAHFRGKAANRHSTQLLNVWRNNPHYPDLRYHFYQELSSSWEEPFEFTEWLTCRNIHILAGKIEKHDYNQQLSQCGIQLCLSGVEGFGHYINEARAMGAVAIVIDAPPMNELIDQSCGILIKPSSSEEMGLVRCHLITERDIKLATDAIIALPQTTLKNLGENARKRYLSERQLFQERCCLLFDLIINQAHPI